MCTIIRVSKRILQGGATLRRGSWGQAEGPSLSAFYIIIFLNKLKIVEITKKISNENIKIKHLWLWGPVRDSQLGPGPVYQLNPPPSPIGPDYDGLSTCYSIFDVPFSRIYKKKKKLRCIFWLYKTTYRSTCFSYTCMYLCSQTSTV